MNADLQQIFESAADDAPRSPLEPYRELILRWRRQGKSYRWIRRMVKEKCGLAVAYGPLYRFVQRRSRPRKSEPETAQPVDLVPAPEPFAPREFSKLAAVQAARQRALLQNLRAKPLATPEPPRKERFEYDPEKPLVIDRSIKE